MKHHDIRAMSEVDLAWKRHVPLACLHEGPAVEVAIRKVRSLFQPPVHKAELAQFAGDLVSPGNWIRMRAESIS